MSSWSKFLVRSGFGFLLLVAVIGVTSAASAATSMYSIGSLSVQGFANDTTTGSTYPYTARVYLGIPLGTFCNEFKGLSPCSGAASVAQNGRPLNGYQHHSLPTVSGPVPFSLAEGRLKQRLGIPATTFTYGLNGTKRPANGVPGGSFSYYYPYIYSYSYADLKNAAGNFFGGGGGPGNWSKTLTESGLNAGSVKVTAGANKYGGTMGLLGFYFSNNGYQRSVGLSVAVSSNWLFSQVGAGKASTVGVGVTATGVNYGVNTGVGATYTGFVKATAFPWTTGTVTVTATRGPFFSVQQRTGYDSRTGAGGGNIQMVSPMLTHWTCPACGTDYETGAVGVLNLEFVPEPENILMFVSGLSMLGLLYRANHRG
jgi:hypothetical protein